MLSHRAVTRQALVTGLEMAFVLPPEIKCF